MTTAIATAPATDEYGLAKLTVQELKERLNANVKKFADNVKRAAENLREMSMILRKLIEHGENIDDIRIGLKHLLRKIAYNQLMPEVVAAFWSSPAAMNRIASLPLPDQKQIVELTESGKGILVASAIKGEARSVPVNQLTASEARQVFAADHIRDENEQIAYLKSREPRVVRARPQFTPDHKKKGINIALGDQTVFLDRALALQLIGQIQ